MISPRTRSRRSSKVLAHMDVNALIGDVIRLGQYDKNKTRTILLKVPNSNE